MIWSTAAWSVGGSAWPQNVTVTGSAKATDVSAEIAMAASAPAASLVFMMILLEDCFCGMQNSIPRSSAPKAVASRRIGQSLAAGWPQRVGGVDQRPHVSERIRHAGMPGGGTQQW